MYRDRSVGTVVLAAGKSSRMGEGVNKVYQNVLDKPVLAHSIESFLDSGFFDEVVLVYNEGEEDLLEEKVLTPLGKSITDLAFKKVPGGDKRQDSSRAGLKASESDYVCIHDGARPNFSMGLAKRLVKAAFECGAAFPGVKPVDTIRVNEQGYAGTTIDRDNYVMVQTPQCFERSLLSDALEEAMERNVYFTDDAGLVMEMSEVIPRVVEGERGNLKITTPEDARLIEALMNA